MFLLIAALLILASPFVAARYLRYSTNNLRRADGAWTLVEQHAHVLMEDRRLNPRVGDMVEALVANVGDGSLTRTFLFSFAFRRRHGSHGGNATHLRGALGALNTQQSEQFSRLLITALFFDSLNAPLSGLVLRRLIYWLANTANDKSAPISQYEVEPMVSAAGRFCHA